MNLAFFLMEGEKISSHFVTIYNLQLNFLGKSLHFHFLSIYAYVMPLLFLSVNCTCSYCNWLFYVKIIGMALYCYVVIRIKYPLTQRCF